MIIPADSMHTVMTSISHDNIVSIFSFKDFSTALALLLVIYTVTDFKYRFRISIAPIYLIRIVFYMIPAIGLLLIATDIYINTANNQNELKLVISIWQSALALSILIPVIFWIYYSFINPPVFGKSNYGHYTSELYNVILKGSEIELRIVADELRRSIKYLLLHSDGDFENNASNNKTNEKHDPGIGRYAYETLLLIADRRLCRHIVASAPGTAITFFDELAEKKTIDGPIAKLARSFACEAVLNSDSMLHHEDEGYNPGLIGVLKPLGKAIFGNYKTVERLSRFGSSPLDIYNSDFSSLSISQFRAYTLSTSITIKSFSNNGNIYTRQHAIASALDNIKDQLIGLSRINSMQDDVYKSEEYSKLSTSVRFACDAVETIGCIEIPDDFPYKDTNNTFKDTILSDISEFMCDIIFSSSYVTSKEHHWLVHHNTVWGSFFGPKEQLKAWHHVHHRLRRKIFNEITIFDQYLSYKAAKILGLCLNVLGLKPEGKKKIHRSTYALHCAIVSWTKNNFLRILSSDRDVAMACLVGTISFDEEKLCLVKTYGKFPGTLPHKEYLYFTPAKTK